MLFIETQTLRHSLERSKRIQLLEELEQQNLKPLIRSARLNCFGNTLVGAERVAELERAIVESLEAENQPYVQGEIFCLDDHVFFFFSTTRTRLLFRSALGLCIRSELRSLSENWIPSATVCAVTSFRQTELQPKAKVLNLRNGHREDQACRRDSSNSSRSRIRIPCSPVCVRKQWSGAFARSRFWKIRARASSCDAPKTLMLRGMLRNCSPETFPLPTTFQ